MSSFTDLCKKGKLNEIKAMLAAPGFDVNQRSKAGKTGLMHAAKEGEKETVLALVTAANINLNAKDKNGNTALHWAIRNNEKNIAIILVKFGAKVDIKNNDGRTALVMAQADGYGSDLNKARPIAPPTKSLLGNEIPNTPVQTKPYKPGSIAEVVDTYVPVIGDVCINPEYYCDTACGPGCMNNCVTCNSSLFNVDCYWDSQSYVGRNCSATTCANGMEWATEFSLHLYSLAEAGVLGLIELCKDCPGAIERCSSGECVTRKIAPSPPAPAAPPVAFTPTAPATVPPARMV